MERAILVEFSNNVRLLLESAIREYRIAYTELIYALHRYTQTHGTAAAAAVEAVAEAGLLSAEGRDEVDAALRRAPRSASLDSTAANLSPPPLSRHETRADADVFESQVYKRSAFPPARPLSDR